MSRIKVTYRLRCAGNEARRLARYIAHEQTVEIPEDIVSQDIREAVVGTVESVRTNVRGKAYDTVISYRSELAGFQIPQLLNLIYGNVSIQSGIRIVDLALPESFLSRFHGPSYGISGIRKLVGVYGRPLFATAIKPNGASIGELARLAHDFALGGGDIVKDDQNLASESLPQFKERISRCHEAVAEANEKTKRGTLYCPILTAPYEEIDERIEFAIRLGVRGFLVCPMLIGIDTARRVAERYPAVYLAHPSLTGTFFSGHSHGIEPSVLLGRIFRLLGADASIFPNFGGRFSFTRKECLEIARGLTAAWPPLQPAFPAPAGGMRFENLPTMGKDYGTDSIFLIGGALLARSEGMEKATRAFLGKIQESFKERIEEPGLASPLQSSMNKSGRMDARSEASRRGAHHSLSESRQHVGDVFMSSCELPGTAGIVAIQTDHLVFKNFTWEGRPPVEYKKSVELPFKDVIRHELVGKNDPVSDFELRYFEIAPGGYTSLEKHRHTHTIVAMRGEGILIKGRSNSAETHRRLLLKPFDIATVASMEVHQLRNESVDPFGFFCIVDRNRDRPMKP